MPVIIAIVVAGLLVAAVITLVERRQGSGDSADIAADPSTVAAQAHRHPRLREFVVRRIDPHHSTGLLLSAALVFVGAATVTVGVVLTMVQHQEGFAEYDDAAARWGAAHTSGAAESVVHVVTSIGSAPAVIAVMAVVGLVERRRTSSWSPAVFMVVVVAAEAIVNTSIKLIVGRERPDIGPLVDAYGSAFPSGHTAATAATYSAAALLLGRGRSRSVQAGLAGAAAGLTVAVAASRVLLGAHWLTDVIAGAAVGWGCFALCSIAFGGRLLQFGHPVEQLDSTPSRDSIQPPHQRSST